MPTRKTLLMTLVIAFCLGGCDVPTAQPIRLGDEPPGPVLVSQPIGEFFSLESILGEIANATGGSGVAGVIYNEETGDWLGYCYASGTAVFEIELQAGGKDTQEIQCSPVGTIRWFYTFWFDLTAFVNQAVFVLESCGNAQALQTRTSAGRLEIRCTALGTYKYLVIKVPEAPDQWYKYECEMGMPLPLPRPPVVGIPVNLAEPFREQGEIVQVVDPWPDDLAVPAVIGALRAPVFGSQFHSPSGTTSVLSAAGDIGLVCQRTGTGSVRISFESEGDPSSREYVLTCHAPHDQGGGG